LHDVGKAPTPFRKRTCEFQVKSEFLAGTPVTSALTGAICGLDEQGTAGGGELPDGPEAQLAGLSWPGEFCQAPRGERLELSEDASTATRTSGVGRGICFVGPLQLENGAAYFEVEVTELEPNWSQTMALGVVNALPGSRNPLLQERARDLGIGSCVVGYDLPKLFSNGMEVAKVPTKLWRPLKELAVGDRVGLLIEREMKLTVFVNGRRRVNVTVPGAKDGRQRWPAELWGVVDVHGTVRSVRLKTGPADPVPQPGASEAEPAEGDPAPAAATAPVAPTSSDEQPPAAGEEAGQLEKSAQPQTDSEGTVAAAEGEAAKSNIVEDGGQQLVQRATGSEVGTGMALSLVAMETSTSYQGAKRRRLCHPCGCLVHLIRHTGTVVHVPREDFVIGRNPKFCNLNLDSPLVPNMVSRQHARIISGTDHEVRVADCKSLNGTYVNGERVEGETLLCQGDVLVIGGPGKSLPDFCFSISMPPPP